MNHEVPVFILPASDLRGGKLLLAYRLMAACSPPSGLPTKHRKPRRVARAAALTFQRQVVRLLGKDVGTAELETGDHVVRFCTRDIGILDRKGSFRSPTDLTGIVPVRNVGHQHG